MAMCHSIRGVGPEVVISRFPVCRVRCGMQAKVVTSGMMYAISKAGGSENGYVGDIESERVCVQQPLKSVKVHNQLPILKLGTVTVAHNYRR